MWAYGFMKGWKASEHIDFNFHDAHDLRPLTDRASPETVRARLRERFSNAKQAIVLVGKSTKYLYRFVRWEIELAQKLDLPIVVVNLNNERCHDPDRCPPLLADWYAVHVSFQMRIIQHALDRFPDSYANRDRDETGPRYYRDGVYKQLGL